MLRQFPWQQAMEGGTGVALEGRPGGPKVQGRGRAVMKSGFVKERVFCRSGEVAAVERVRWL